MCPRFGDTHDGIKQSIYWELPD
jgi:hypothetical protein